MNVVSTKTVTTETLENKNKINNITAIKTLDKNNKICDKFLSFMCKLHWVYFVHHVASFVYAMVLQHEIIILHYKVEPWVLLYLYWPLFITVWAFSFQAVFLCLALTHDVLEWLDKNESNFGTKIRYWRDLVFGALVFPFTLFVTGMFWSVYWCDRELVFPKVYDTIVPWWFNHCVHTNITVVLLIETLLQARRYPVNGKLELGLNTFVSVLYAVVYYSIYFFAHRWLYGVFGVMTWWQVCLFQLLIWTSIFFFYMIQYPINRLIHGSEEEKLIELETKTNGIEAQIKTEMPKAVNPDLLTPPLTSKTFSLKYKSIRERFENSRL